MSQGHEESSAYAICRSSMGLLSDGSEDGKDIDMTAEQVVSRAGIAMQFGNGPSLVKEMIVCGPMGKFVNGDFKGVMDRKLLSGIAERFKKYPRQVPVFMLGDHPEDNDQQRPVGWVEGLRIDGDMLAARVKLHGSGASAVGGDLIRGASIYTVTGKNPDGSAQGEVLKHLLLTNEPFYKDLNIAAARKGGEPVECYFTALEKKEGVMPDDPKDKQISTLKDENTALKDQITALKAVPADEKLKAAETLLVEKEKKILGLRAANENLKGDVDKFQKSPALEDAMLRLKAQERQIRAAKIRRLVMSGVAAGQFNLAQVGDPEKGYDHKSDEVVLAWFKAGFFGDSIEKLEFALDTFEKKSAGRKFNSGAPPTGEVALSAEDREAIRKLGQDPEAVLASMRAGQYDYAQHKALTAQKGK